MKNLKINENLKTRIKAFGLSLVTLGSGFVIGHSIGEKKTSSSDVNVNSNTEIISEYLEEYINERNSLEQEIKDLLEKKEQLQDDGIPKKEEIFAIRDLIVIENTNINGESNLYILKLSTSDIYHEYQGVFNAWYKMGSYAKEHFPEYVYFDEYEKLFNYLTDEELSMVESNNGLIKTSQLDKILGRIRSEYQENLSQNSIQKNYSNK